jgi:hypothetical protein
VVAALAAGIRHFLDRPERVEGHAFPVPAGEDRIVAEVLNGTEVNGLARVGTRLLRQAGIDVVYFGGAAKVDSTTVIVRRGDRVRGEAVRKVLGLGRVREQRDTTRHVDVSVILGPDFRRMDTLHP